MKNKKLLQLFATMISISMIFGCMPAAVAADEINDTEVAEQTDGETGDESGETEPFEPEEETEDETDPSEETVPDEQDETFPVDPGDEEPEESLPDGTEPGEDEPEEDAYIFEYAESGDAEVSTYDELIDAIACAPYGGTIRLTDDIDTEAMIVITIGRNIILDLNGHTLNRGLQSPDYDGHVIIVNSGGILNVQDSAGGGMITGGYANNGGGINNKGALYITGGTICGNHVAQSDFNGKGAGIYNSGNLVISNCVISGNTGDNGGGIYNDNGGVVTMSDMSITDNRSLNHGGGGIVNCGYINLIGNCSITGNYARSNGGGLWNESSFHMSGCNYICNNTSELATDNIYLMSGTVIDIDSLISGELWVSTARPFQTITRGWIATDDINIFKLDNGCIPSVFDGEVREASCYVNRYWDGNEVVSEVVMCPENIRTITDHLTSGWYYAADYHSFGERIIIEEGATVNLILDDNCYMTCEKGIEVPPGAVLNIYGQQNDSGCLCAANTGRDACIGATRTGANGMINIYGGTINANARCSEGAGIGGGDARYFGAEEGGDRISIYGGYVYAQGSSKGAGIGGNFENCGPDIYIYGGHIEASGGSEGAGIGGGYYAGCPSAIVINGGEVIACGGSGASGIGEGFDPSDSASKNSVITINGGDIKAYGGTGGAGIGGGEGCNTKISIVINDGTVNAIGGEAGGYFASAGIGAGANVRLSFTGGGDFAGTITIRGGHVRAEGTGYFDGSDYYGGAGIGAGLDGDMSGTINIEDGYIECIGKCGGAPIGGGANSFIGYGDMTGTVNIIRGYIILRDDSYSQMSIHPQIIGHGADADVSGTLNLGSNITVWYDGQTPVAPSERSTVLRGSTGRTVYVNGF